MTFDISFEDLFLIVGLIFVCIVFIMMIIGVLVVNL